jgi:hypothetical protein
LPDTRTLAGDWVEAAADFFLAGMRGEVNVAKRGE